MGLSHSRAKTANLSHASSHPSQLNYRAITSRLRAQIKAALLSVSSHKSSNNKSKSKNKIDRHSSISLATFSSNPSSCHDRLPLRDVKAVVCSFLSITDRFAVCLVNKAWRDACRHPLVWRDVDLWCVPLNDSNMTSMARFFTPPSSSSSSSSQNLSASSSSLCLRPSSSYASPCYSRALSSLHSYSSSLTWPSTFRLRSPNRTPNREASTCTAKESKFTTQLNRQSLYAHDTVRSDFYACCPETLRNLSVRSVSGPGLLSLHSLSYTLRSLCLDRLTDSHMSYLHRLLCSLPLITSLTLYGHHYHKPALLSLPTLPLLSSLSAQDFVYITGLHDQHSLIDLTLCNCPCQGDLLLVTSSIQSLSTRFFSCRPSVKLASRIAELTALKTMTTDMIGAICTMRPLRFSGLVSLVCTSMLHDAEMEVIAMYLRELRELEFKESALSEEGIRSLGTIASLCILRITCVCASASSPALCDTHLIPLLSLTSLQSISLDSFPALSDQSIVTVFALLPSLRDLTFSGCDNVKLAESTMACVRLRNTRLKVTVSERHCTMRKTFSGLH